MITEKTLKFLSLTGQLDDQLQPIYEPVEKRAHFYALSQNDKRQAKLLFMMRPLYQSIKMIGAENARIIADPAVLYDLTLYAIDCLLIVDELFTEMDKKEFLNDNFAVLNFGEVFLEEATPFFLSYFAKYLT